MLLPRPRGPLSAQVIDVLRRPVDADADLGDLDVAAAVPSDLSDPLADEDLQLTLWVLYELHYRGFDDADDAWEWAPALLAVRARLERRFEAALRRLTAPHVDAALRADGDLADRLFGLCAGFEGAELSPFVRKQADRDQVLEFLRERSVYHLKESDPHTWVVPRLDGAAKAGLVEVQYDEYGDGRPERVHQKLFADALAAAGLDPSYGAYVDEASAQTLAVSNAMSLFGLHRRLRGAALGHLAAFEATSSIPCRRYAAGVRRVGLDETVAHYFDEHVLADAVHEQLAVRGVCGALVQDDPTLERDVLLGAAACLAVEALSAERMLARWADDTDLAEREEVGA